MAVDEQGVNVSRYMVIPRVVVFVRRGDDVLLLKIAPKGGKITRWTGRYNGVGGHVERGEDLLTAARRELREEAGVDANLRLRGSLVVDVGGVPGIGLFVFAGEYVAGAVRSGREGQVDWVPLEMVKSLPVVDDLPILLEKALSDDPEPFCGRSFYDEYGLLQVIFGK